MPRDLFLAVVEFGRAAQVEKTLGEFCSEALLCFF
jgi:hypothetical protein